MFFARFAYLSVFRVSSKELTALEMFAIMTVLQLPPSESFSRRVSRESRYGTKAPLLPFSPSALMQLPSARRLRLMFAPSRSICPRLRVVAARSLPARSTRLSFPMRSLLSTPGATSRDSTSTCSTACERLDTSFAAVAFCVRLRLPRWSSSMISSGLFVSCSVMPATQGPLSGSSRRSRQSPPPAMRSRMFSL